MENQPEKETGNWGYVVFYKVKSAKECRIWGYYMYNMYRAPEASRGMRGNVAWRTVNGCRALGFRVSKSTGVPFHTPQPNYHPDYWYPQNRTLSLGSPSLRKKDLR